MQPTHEFSRHFGDDAVEARIVAWVLGEASSSESADLERLCAVYPELSDFRQKMSALHESLSQVESSAVDLTWKLPPKKRRNLEEIFSGKVIARANHRPTLRMVLAIAACFLVAAVVLPNLMPDPAINGANSVTQVIAPAATRAAETYDVASLARSKNRDSGRQEATRQRQLAEKKPSESSAITAAAIPAVGPNLAAVTTDFVMEPVVQGTPAGALSGPGMDFGSDQASSVSQSIAAASPPMLPSVAAMSVADSETRLARNEKSNDRQVVSSADRVGAMAPAYVAPDPRANPARNSTFPFNSGETSFQLAKAALAQSIRPDPSTIQLEQFYNAVDYADPAPTVGEIVAATIDHSAHPFLPGAQLVRIALRVGSTNPPSIPAAEEVTVEVEFNPQRVGKHQLLGFEKDGLSSRAMGNVSGDRSGVAIYQIELIPGSSGEMGRVSIRFRNPNGNEMTERTWMISEQASPISFGQAAPSMQLAGLSLLAAEKLQGGPQADLIHFDQLTGSISRVKQYYRNSPRVGEMLQLIDQLK